DPAPARSWSPSACDGFADTRGGRSRAAATRIRSLLPPRAASPAPDRPCGACSFGPQPHLGVHAEIEGSGRIATIDRQREGAERVLIDEQLARHDVREALRVCGD